MQEALDEPWGGKKQPLVPSFRFFLYNEEVYQEACNMTCFYECVCVFFL